MNHSLAEEGRVPSALLMLNTTRDSFLHWIFRATEPINRLRWWRDWVLPYLIVIVLFAFMPLVVAMATQPVWWTRTQDMQHPVLRDYNILCMSLLTLPLIIVFLLTEKNLIPNRIDSVREDGVLRPKNDADFANLCSNWEERFRQVNIWAQIAGIAVGVILSFWLYHEMLTTPPIGGYLMTKNKEIWLSGWIFLCWQVPVFACVCAIYIIRGITTVIFLWCVVEASTVKPQPFHPDNAGGLRPVGRIGLRNQYLLATAGINVVLLAVVTRSLVKMEPAQTAILLTYLSLGAGFYLLAGPVVFVGPLLPFRKSMLDEKMRLLRSIAAAFRHKLDSIVGKLDKSEPTESDEETIQRLTKLKELVEKCPVWPFDTVTLAHFLTAYLVPFVAALPTLTPIGTKIVKYLNL